MNIIISINDTITKDETVPLYKADKWSSAEQPDFLFYF
jgi:hypothetical protein